jgi:hypothetical protein
VDVLQRAAVAEPHTDRFQRAAAFLAAAVHRERPNVMSIFIRSEHAARLVDVLLDAERALRTPGHTPPRGTDGA